ncbi:MAG TPA: 4-(cytidine 5'-diphospho)-2-C-methyl-D-erythritol kinase [Candidatus Krumholzibacteria bacterium]|nr:4-(cytidine 5'-diphospho)-2-C-methyl-D-erythritol kinase [Candidatus Krumholzibacteria bacterium]
MHRVHDAAAKPGRIPTALQVVTRAKVNLSLEVIRRREDGYHEIETIFQCIDLADTIHVEFTSDANIDIECSAPDIPVDERNLCHRAVVAMRPLAGPSLGARMRIEKRIPSGAGLGGGSSNAAGILRAVCHALRLDVPRERLEKVAAGLGSDVPFFLYGGTMLGRGRGEVLTPLEPLKSGTFLVVKPAVSIPTAWVYAQPSFGLTSHRPRLNLKNANSVLARFPRGALPFRNALEAAVLPAYPVVARLVEELLTEQPCFASMTGSGSAVYAIFETESRAVEVARRFSVRGLFTSVAKPARQAIDIR